MSNRDSNQPPSSREQSHARFLRREQEKQREYERLRIQKELSLFKPDELTEAERKQLESRKRQVELMDQLAQLESQQQTAYLPSTVGLNEDGFIDVKQQEELLTARARATDDQSSGIVHKDVNWDQQQAHMAFEEYLKSTHHPGQQQQQQQHKYDTRTIAGREQMSIDFIMGKTSLPGNQRVGVTGPALVGKGDDDTTLSEYEKIQKQRKQLPVYQYRDQLIEEIRKNQVLIVEGETGSGKTTQIIQYLYEEGFCNNDMMIGCTQPRRLAAMSVASRVACEKGVILGEEVGYTVRFDDNTSELTRIKYLTDGMLLREFLTTPLLDKYSVIMIDEAHERTLHTDILFGLLKEIIKHRKDLKLIIASATLDVQKFCKFFNNAPHFFIPGRTYNVDIYYTKAPEADYIEAAVLTVLQIHRTQPRGDILVFLPGQEDIETMEDILREKMSRLVQSSSDNIAELLILPIYANLPSELQNRIFLPTPEDARKVVLSTNIAETSLTIDGIIYVIDPGFCKLKVCNTTSGTSSFESLIVTPISKASANQRAGRAGRVAPGKCFRLYTYDSYLNDLPDTTPPEIHRSNLSPVVLLLKSLGINNLIHFDFIDPPTVKALEYSLVLLYSLGAFTPSGELTRVGRKMADLPLDPMLSKTLLKSAEYKCTKDIIIICSMMSVGAVTFRPRKDSTQADNAHKSFAHPLGDHFTMLTMYNDWEENENDAEWARTHFLQQRMLLRAKDIVKQLTSMSSRVGIDLQTIQLELHTEKQQYIQSLPKGDLTEASQEDLWKREYEKRIQLSILSGFFPNIAKLDGSGSSYSTLKNGTPVYIHPSSCLYRSPTSKGEIKRAMQKQSQNGGGPGFIGLSDHDIAPLPGYVVYNELVRTKREYIRNLMVIDPLWISKIAPHYYPTFQRDYIASQKTSKSKRR